MSSSRCQGLLLLALHLSRCAPLGRRARVARSTRRPCFCAVKYGVLYSTYRVYFSRVQTSTSRVEWSAIKTRSRPLSRPPSRLFPANSLLLLDILLLLHKSRSRTETILIAENRFKLSSCHLHIHLLGEVASRVRSPRHDSATNTNWRTRQ